jgi:hypothetical protein
LRANGIADPDPDRPGPRSSGVIDLITDEGLSSSRATRARRSPRCEIPAEAQVTADEVPTPIMHREGRRARRHR